MRGIAHCSVLVLCRLSFGMAVGPIKPMNTAAILTTMKTMPLHSYGMGCKNADGVSI